MWIQLIEFFSDLKDLFDDLKSHRKIDIYAVWKMIKFILWTIFTIYASLFFLSHEPNKEIDYELDQIEQVESW